MPTWPPSLPQKPVNGGWSEKNERNVAMFQPEVGPPKQRRRNTANGSKASARFVMTAADIAALDAFYSTDLVDGTLPFTWFHPITSAPHSWIFLEAPDVSAAFSGIHDVTIMLQRLP